MTSETDSSFLHLPLEPIDRQTATEAVAEQLLTLINDGVLQPGSRLPPERELAQQFQVSRTTVREALKLLTLSGLLEARRGSGTFVREDYVSFVANQLHWPMLLSGLNTQNIFEVREALELQAARLAARTATEQELEKITVFRKLVAIQDRDIERETEIDLAFHEAVAAASHNPLLLRLMLSLHDLLKDYIRSTIEATPDLATTHRGHQAIYDAIVAGDSEAAAQAMSAHLHESRGRINCQDNL
jgi:GntR family transcriptional repressor for pyruvate dehydrogenase complex